MRGMPLGSRPSDPRSQRFMGRVVVRTSASLDSTLSSRLVRCSSRRLTSCRRRPTSDSASRRIPEISSFTSISAWRTFVSASASASATSFAARASAVSSRLETINFLITNPPATPAARASRTSSTVFIAASSRAKQKAERGANSATCSATMFRRY